MSVMNFSRCYRSMFDFFFSEDDLGRNALSITRFPDKSVKCQLKIKTPCLLAGGPFFAGAFGYLGADEQTVLKHLEAFEGKQISQPHIIEFSLPLNIAIHGERIALNVLQRASAVATATSTLVRKLEGTGVRLLDTRKTTPGLRALEKYAVNVGGGFNHRFGQSDAFMIKDNHKACLGGLKGAWEFFKSFKGHYTPIIAEIHGLEELREAFELGIQHLMLDNFSVEEVKQAISMKSAGHTYEVSGGITLDTISDYALEGVDAISVGSVTYNADAVDISLKYRP